MPLIVEDYYGLQERPAGLAGLSCNPEGMDEVSPSFGRGPILTPGPGPACVPSRALSGIVGGPGPPPKMGPRPKTRYN